MVFKKQGKELKSKIEVIKESKIVRLDDNKKMVIAGELKVLCPHCKKVIGTKIGNIYQILDKRLVSLKGTVCPKCKKELIK